jgi:F1F0 ATPase subunit 2
VTAPAIVLGLVAGLVLGWVHFAGLWWTVRRLPGARRPGALLLASYLVRGLLIGAGLLAVVGLGPWPLVAATIGFVAARQAALRRYAGDGGGGPT